MTPSSLLLLLSVCVVCGAGRALANTPSPSATPPVPFVEFDAGCGPTGDYLQPYCCSGSLDIGYTFPFGCGSFTTFSLQTSPSIRFGEGACYNFTYPTFSPFINFDTLLPRGGATSRLVTIGGASTRVIEWSGIYVNYPVYVHFGSVQVYLFRNGTIGVVYHLTGRFFGPITEYCNSEADASTCVAVSPSDGSFLRTSETYLFTPQPTDCNAPLTMATWPDAPDICYNGINVDNLGDYADLMFVGPYDCNATNGDQVFVVHGEPNAYCTDHDAIPLIFYNATDLPYTHNTICVADQSPYPVWSNEAEETASTVPSQSHSESRSTSPSLSDSESQSSPLVCICPDDHGRYPHARVSAGVLAHPSFVVVALAIAAQLLFLGANLHA